MIKNTKTIILTLLLVVNSPFSALAQEELAPGKGGSGGSSIPVIRKDLPPPSVQVETVNTKAQEPAPLESKNNTWMYVSIVLFFWLTILTYILIKRTGKNNTL